jgi:mono/diheme cytochrome c family protein
MTRILLVTALLMAVAISFTHVPAVTAGETAAVLDLEAAKVTFEKRCSLCHTVDRPLGKNKDRAGWETTVKRMAGKKAFPAEDQEIIIDYLTNIRGPKM